MAKQKGLEIDRRVGIALSVLPVSEKKAIERVIGSSRAFEHAAALPNRVQPMKASGQPLYMMRVSPSLRLVYTLVGDTVYVLDVVKRATLDRFAVRKSVKSAAKKRADGEKKSKALAKKLADAVEK